MAFLEDNGGDPRNVGEDYIEAYVPVTLLGPVSERPGVLRVREIVPPQPEFGPVISQGVQAHGSQPWNNAGYSGQGVKVGVIDSFEGLRSLMGTELRATVVGRCYTDVAQYSSNLAACDRDSSHGTAVAEAIVDVAPEVALYIANPISPADLSSTVRWMAAQGVTVINRSASRVVFEGPGDGTSDMSNNIFDAINYAADNGIVWVNSAGNYGKQNWVGQPSIDANGFMYFDGSDVFNRVFLDAGQRIDIIVRWDDRWGGASRDLDVCIFDTVDIFNDVCSEDPQNGLQGHYPIEHIGAETSESGVFAIEITHYTGALPSWVQLQVRGAELQYSTPQSSINNASESDNQGMLAVGASHYWDTNTIASYSSRGPTLDGRVKPDIVGTACAATASYEIEPPQFYGGNSCWFPGTSQAAPHVAGMAALVKQANPSFTPQQVAEYLKSNAAERGASGPDNTWGYGFAQLPLPPTQPPPSTEPDPGETDTCGESISGDGATSGEWSSSGCQSEVTDRGYARYYGITVEQETEVTIDLESSLDTFLYLRSGDAQSGMVLHEDDDVEVGVDTDSRIVASLPAGSYTIEATTFNPGEAGSFTLTISGLDESTTTEPTTPEPGETDTCGESISGDGATSGEWSSSGCQSEVTDRGYARYYGITVEQETEVTIDLESSLDTFLYLRSGDAQSGMVLHEDDDVEVGVDTDSRIVASLPAGSYTIEATTFNPGEAGSFTLTISGLDESTTTEPTTPEPGETDTCGESISGDGATSGEWSSSGCQSEVTDRGYARYYGMTVEQETEVTIDLESSLDTFLYLRSGDAQSGMVLHEDDDVEVGVDTDSRIVASLPAGSYTIEATTFNPGEAGSFTLTISGLDESTTTEPTTPEPGETDTCGESISGDGATSGEWSSSGCQSEVTDRGYARYYGMTVEQETEVTIDLESSLDTFLYLRSGDAQSGMVLHEDDDVEVGVDTDSRIVASLPAGSYTIEATTFNPGEAGSFTLTISGLDESTTTEPTTPEPGETDTCGESISGDGATSGEWSSSGCQSEVTDRGYARYYGMTVEQETEVTIDLESSLDTFLYLRSGDAQSGMVLHEDDDVEVGVDTDSRIVASLPAGSYTIEATTFNPGEAGSFTLTISGLDESTTTEPTTPEPGETDTCGESISGDGATSGEWSSSGCQSEVTDRGYARYYGMTVEQETEVTIDLESSLDTFLYLRSGDAQSGMVLHEDDDVEVGVDTDSRIVASLPAGSYTIEATTFNPGEAGSFTLTISGLGAG